MKYILIFTGMCISAIIVTLCLSKMKYDGLIDTGEYDGQKEKEVDTKSSST